MQTPPASLPDLYKTAGHQCALRDLGLISQEEFEKEAWIPAAISAVATLGPMLYKGVKGLFSRGGKAVAGAAQRGAGQVAQRGQQALQQGQAAARTMGQNFRGAMPTAPNMNPFSRRGASAAQRQPYFRASDV